MYLTYWLDTVTGPTLTLSSTTLNTILPQQRYIVLENKTQFRKRHSNFKINNVDDLPYMRKIELAGYDGLWFLC